MYMYDGYDKFRKIRWNQKELVFQESKFQIKIDVSGILAYCTNFVICK